MTPTALKETMTALGFSTADLAILMGVSRRTPQFWLSGHAPMPQSASILLESIREGLVTIEWVEDKIVLAMKSEVA